MTARMHAYSAVFMAAFLSGCATCGPGTVESDGAGWRFERDGFLLGWIDKSPGKVCLPISPISDCTEHQMAEEDGGGWRIDRDGAGWRIDRDGAGWRRERDEPNHPADAGANLSKIAYSPSAVCRIGVEPPDLP